MRFVNKLSDFLGKYFIGLVVAMAIVALVLPQSFLTLGKMKPFGQPIVNVGLGVIMFVMGLTLKVEDFKVVFTKPKEVLVGCTAQFVVMPFLGYFLAKVFHLPSELAVGLVLLGTCPGGTASNVMTYLAKGDVALSVGMTTVSTLLSPLLTPALTLFLAGQWVEVNAMAMFLSIVQVVLVPILLGLVVHYFLDDLVTKYSKALVILPIVSIILIMGLCVAPNKTNLMNSGAYLVLAVCLHNWGGFLLGYLVGEFSGMTDAQKKALSIEVGLQNSGLAVGLSAQFNNPLCTLPAAVATVSHQLSGSVLANVFSGNVNFNLEFLKLRKVKVVKTKVQ